MILDLLTLAQIEGHSAASEDVSLVDKFGFSGPHFVSQLIVFGILAFVLKKYAFDPILKVLDERRNTIKESVDNAEKIKLELEKAEATRKQIIQKANEQATLLISDAQKAALAQGERRLQEAIAQAEQIIAKAHEATALDRERMLTELKQEVARLVVDTTSKVVGKVLTPEDQSRLNEETARQIASTN